MENRMKYNILLLIILLISNVAGVRAQTDQLTSVQLNWKGVEKWHIDSTVLQVISFHGAKFPDETRLPYFHHRVSCNPSYSYTVEIKNRQYSTLGNDENKLLSSQLHLIPQNITANTNILRERGSSYLDIHVLPMVLQDGKIVKLTSFDLHITKSTQAQKAPAATKHTYAASSVLAQGKFVKIRISNSGVYKLTFEDLNSMGINPANVRIFGYGGGVLEQSFMLHKWDDLPEVAIWMEKGSDGVFNAGDYILFYGQGITRWTYDKSRSMFVHIPNPYSKYGYYFVTSDAGTGKKIQDNTINIPAQAEIKTVEEFVDFQVYEKDLVNLAKSGKEFYGEIFNETNSYTFPFSFPNPVTTNSTVTRLDVAATASVATSFTLSLNNSQTKTLAVAAKAQDNYEQGKSASGIFMFTPQGETFSFNISYIKSNASAVGYLNFLEINARRHLRMSGSNMQFQNVDNLGINSYNRYLLSDANANIKIWDITDPVNISTMPTENIGGKLGFVASATEVSRYLAIDPTAAASYPKPEITGVVPNQNLHSLSPVDMIILTHPNFVSQANTLAQAHREKSNLTVEVITTEQVYNEFSSGTPDATAYRWVMKMLYDRALATNNLTDIPKYLLLFGKGSFDNRGVRNDTGNSLVLTYQAENSLVTTLSYVTDDYFGFLDDNEGTQIPSHLLDIAIGRFTVTTAQQATDVVNKTIAYMNNDRKGSWKNQICFVADDGDGALHMKQADSIAVSLARSYPAYQINKIYMDAFQQEITASGQSYPLAKNRFQNLLRSGLLLLNYTGHAGPLGWTNENILTVGDVKTMTNKNLPLWVAATCDFVQFDNQTLSAGEMVLFNPVGGGMGILSAARPVYASQNFTLDKLFCETLFKRENGEHMRIGDVIRKTKNAIGSEINKLSYVYVGDPAVKLNYPTNYKIITSKVNESATFGNDTLRALSTATIEGYIADENGQKVTSFNGSVYAVVYDKLQKITTLNNENDGALTYFDRQNVLFSGNAVVKDGVFSFSFMLPKDIKYNYASGRINYYAYDKDNGSEAQGHFENFIVGGTKNEVIDDTEGPKVQMYLNSTNFASGDKVNEAPMFIANISDVHGINTVGSGIGHDVLLTIDHDPTQSYILNDYFQAAPNSFTEGVVRFKLPEMKDGKHTLTFRVWDLLNNSTTETINFEVAKGLTPVIFSVHNYPNPVKNRTNIVVSHDRPETILSTKVEIFDLTGRKIWNFSQSTADNIAWDLTTNDGYKVNTGIYLYRVSIKTADSELTSKTNKMLIVGQ